MNYKLETIKQQAASFKEIGATIAVKYLNNPLTPVYIIMIIKGRMYRLSDPDINVIIAQLTTLYLNLKKMDLLNDVKSNENGTRRA